MNVVLCLVVRRLEVDLPDFEELLSGGSCQLPHKEVR